MIKLNKYKKTEGFIIENGNHDTNFSQSVYFWIFDIFLQKYYYITNKRV